ncbi:MAG: hypothetical protein ACYC8T_38165 [Myxococcaceae bacterium]
MAEDQNKRPAPVSVTERASPMDRVKQIQDLQRAAEAKPSLPARPAAAASGPEAPRAPMAAFEAQAVRRATADVPRPTGAEQAIYGRAQVDPAKLFGGEKIEVTGNPWKVISFATMLPVVFDPQKPLANYDAKVPPNAVKADEGLLFQVSLTPKDGKTPPLKRTVLTGPGGELRGVESRNAGELKSLLGRAAGLAGAVFKAAFGGAERPAAAPARVADVKAGKSGGYDVTVSSGEESRSVAVNNFGLPLTGGIMPSRAHIDVASYMLDRFEAA